jgi:hypothetical protein
LIHLENLHTSVFNKAKPLLDLLRQSSPISPHTAYFATLQHAPAPFAASTIPSVLLGSALPNGPFPTCT